MEEMIAGAVTEEIHGPVVKKAPRRMSLIDELLNLQPHQLSASLTDKIFLFYGGPETRKTSVATKFDNHLMAAFEVGFKFNTGTYAKVMSTWTDFRAFVRALKSDKLKGRYDTIIIDTITLAWSACVRYVLDKNDVEDIGDIKWGKGFRAVRREFEETILSIPQMGYGLLMIAHSDDMKNEDDIVIRSKVDIDKRPSAIIKGLADFIMFMKKEYRAGMPKTDENQTVMAYTKLVDIETKSRSRYFAPKFEFTYENLTAEFRYAIEKQKQAEGIMTVEEQNLFMKEESDVSELRNEIKEYVMFFMSDSAPDIARTKTKKLLDSILPNIKVPEATKMHLPQLLVLKEELITLKESM